MNEYMLSEPIQNLNISNRAKNALVGCGFITVWQLVNSSEAELMRIPGFGNNSLAEVKRVLNSFEFDLRKGRTIPLEDKIQSTVSRLRSARKKFEEAWNELIELQKLASEMEPKPEKTLIPDVGGFGGAK